MSPIVAITVKQILMAAAGNISITLTTTGKWTCSTTQVSKKGNVIIIRISVP